VLQATLALTQSLGVAGPGTLVVCAEDLDKFRERIRVLGFGMVL
jgi:hypothetical protein